MGRSSRWLTRGIFVPRPFLELLEDRTVPAHFYNFVDPSPSVGNRFGTYIVPLATGNVVVTAPYDDSGATDAGAVYLFSGSTGVLISTLKGSQPNDRVGLGVTALTNGNFVVSSPLWDNGAATDAGAVTWGSGTTGVKGVVSTANSLVGSKTGDGVGYGEVTALSNGNFVVRSPAWANGAATDAGAVTWGNGTTGVTGTVSTMNSIFGSQTGDQVGSGYVTALPNGNYLVNSPNWANGAIAKAGAVTALLGSKPSFGTVQSKPGVKGVLANTDPFSSLPQVVDMVNGHYYVWFVQGAPDQAGGLVLAGSIPSAIPELSIPILTTTPGVSSGVSLWGTGGMKLGTIDPYPGYKGRILTAIGDVNGDGIPDIVTGRGAGVPALVKVFDGKLQKEVNSFNAYAPNFLGGITLALADTDGDGKAEIITGTGNGSVPHVKVMKSDGFVVASFYAYATDFTKGVNLATGDMNGDGKADIVTWPNPGGGPHVRVFQALPDGKFAADKDGKGVSTASFFAYDSKYTGGFSLALGDVDGVAGLEILTMRGPTTPLFTGVATAKRFSASGVLQKEWPPIAELTQGGHILVGDLNMNSIAEVIVAAGVGAESTLVVTDGMGTVHAQKTVYDLPFKNGFNMSLVDLNGDRVMEIAVAPGAGIAGLVQRFDHNLTLLDSFFALDSSYTGGVWLK